MKRFFLIAVLAMVFSPKAAGISFSKEVAPIFQQKCVTCHGAEKTKGGFRLDSFAALNKAGDSDKKPIEAGAPEKSHLFALLVTKDADDRMPQKADPLSKDEIGTIRRWIKEGAQFDGGDESWALARLVPPPPQSAPPERYPAPLPITALAWNDAGDRIVTGGFHEAFLWETNGTLRARIGGLPERIHGVALAGGKLAVGGGAPLLAGEVMLADLENAEAPRLLLRTADVIVCLAINPAGNLLAAGGADNAIHFFELPSGRETLVLNQHADWVTALAFSRDGTRLASASRDRTARLFDAANGNLLETYAEHAKPLYAISMSADGKTILSGGLERKIHVWSSADAKKKGELAFGDGEVSRIAVGSERVFAAGSAGRIAVFKDGKKERELAGHKDWIYTLALHEGTKRLASGSYNGEVRIWDAETGEGLGLFTAAP